MISQPLSHSATHVAQETSVRQTLLFTTHVSMHERAAFFRHSHELTAAAMNSHLQLQIHTCSHLLTATNSHLQPFTHSHKFTPAAIHSQPCNSQRYDGGPRNVREVQISLHHLAQLAHLRVWMLGNGLSGSCHKLRVQLIPAACRRMWHPLNERPEQGNKLRRRPEI